ncbi:hypothetical protein ACFV80_33160 [Streptomyces sp. NPDC059862]|uniref:hypothetical protein n=1 Tax=Streptomyces sp. NPDC059862 TaxID=3346975 RepID=UPI003669A4E3
MNHRTEVVPPPTFTPSDRHGHRKPKQFGAGARRALVLAMAVPVASVALVGPPVFAADGNTTATNPDTAPLVPQDHHQRALPRSAADRFAE